MNTFLNIFSVRVPTNKNRILILDFIRGILILLVLYHHSGAYFSSYVLQFHMPALFILSGYTEFILNKKIKFSDYVKARFFRLIVPYLFFEMANLILFVGIQILSGTMDLSFVDAIKSIVTCINNSYMGLYGRLWFLPAMFVCSVFSFVIKEVISSNKTFAIALFIAVMMILSYISCYIIPFRLPFTIDTAFLGTAFFLIGHLCGKYIERYLNNKNRIYDILLIVGFAVLFVICNICADPVCHMFTNQYRSFPFMIIAAISGTALVFIFTKQFVPLFEKVHFINDIVIWYSVNSLATFPVHLTIKVLSIPILQYLGLNHWTILLVVMLLLNIPIVNIITHYCPVMLGCFKTRAKANRSHSDS